MRRTLRRDGLALLQHDEQAQTGAITEAQVLGLPEPLQRYLRNAQVVGKEPIRTVRLKQRGFMRLQPVYWLLGSSVQKPGLRDGE
jgi:hypothetical protein